MKLKSIIPGCFGMLIAAASICPRPCRADDYITYSVPFAIPPPASSIQPHVSTTFSDTSGNGSLEVQKYTFDLNGIGFALNQDTGIAAEIGAAQYWFPHGNQIVPNGESEAHGHLGFWRNLTPDWSASAGLTEDVAGDGRPYEASSARTSFDANFSFHPSDIFQAHLELTETTIEGVSYVGPSVGYAWNFDPRWQLAGSFSYSIGTAFPRAVLRYEISKGLHVYGGLVTDGDIFHVSQPLGNPVFRDHELYYYQTALRIGTDWNVSKGWDIGVSLGYSLKQQFGYRR